MGFRVDENYQLMEDGRCHGNGVSGFIWVGSRAVSLLVDLGLQDLTFLEITFTLGSTVGYLFGYYRGLNTYQYHFEVHLRHHILSLYKEYGTIILVIIQGPLLCGLESGTNRILRLEEICMTATCVRAALHPNASKTLNPKP